MLFASLAAIHLCSLGCCVGLVNSGKPYVQHLTGGFFIVRWFRPYIHEKSDGVVRNVLGTGVDWTKLGHDNLRHISRSVAMHFLYVYTCPNCDRLAHAAQHFFR